MYMKVRALRFVPFVVLVGCVGVKPTETREISVNPQQDLELKRMWSRGDLSEYRMLNRSTQSISYWHFAGQGPEPVAYCLHDDGSQWICSEQVLLEGDDASGYTESGHDTILEGHKSVTFRVRVGQGAKVGIKVFPASAGAEVRAEVILWSQE